MSPPRVLVVGAGAIGGVTAAKLALAGRGVVVLDANVAHVERLRGTGLVVDVLGDRQTVPLEAYASAAEPPGRFDYALITLKAPHHGAALAPLAERGIVDTYVSLGNGLVQERIADLVGRDRLIAGTVEWGATNHGPGHVAQTTTGSFVVGELDGLVRDRTRGLAEVLEAAAAVRVSTNIHGQVWSKLLVNSSFSGLGAVTGLLYGEAVEDAVGQRVAYTLWTEGYDVARAVGVELEEVRGIVPEGLTIRGRDDEPRARQALHTYMSQAAATKASMLQDLERGAPTEVDVINGAVVEHGAKAGVATPLNTRVVELVHGYELGHGSPSPAALGELDALLATP